MVFNAAVTNNDDHPRCCADPRDGAYRPPMTWCLPLSLAWSDVIWH